MEMCGFLHRQQAETPAASTLHIARRPAPAIQQAGQQQHAVCAMESISTLSNVVLLRQPEMCSTMKDPVQLARRSVASPTSRSDQARQPGANNLRVARGLLRRCKLLTRQALRHAAGSTPFASVATKASPSPARRRLPPDACERTRGNQQRCPPHSWPPPGR